MFIFNSVYLKKIHTVGTQIFHSRKIEYYSVAKHYEF